MHVDYAFLQSSDPCDKDNAENEIKMNVWMLNNPEHQLIE
jgi:hypothetical protein